MLFPPKTITSWQFLAFLGFIGSEFPQNIFFPKNSPSTFFPRVPGFHWLAWLIIPLTPLHEAENQEFLRWPLEHIQLLVNRNLPWASKDLIWPRTSKITFSNLFAGAPGTLGSKNNHPKLPEKIVNDCLCFWKGQSTLGP